MALPASIAAWWPSIRAGGVLIVGVVLLVMGLPGFDYLQAAPSRADGPVLEAMARVDRAWRQPLVRPLAHWEQRLGVRQNWHFYSTGASRTRHFEIRVDGELWHRSNDPDADFLAAQLAYPRLRHASKDWVRAKRGWLGKPLFRYVQSEVLAVRPDAQQIELVGLEGRWPGRKQERVQGLMAQAPGWTIRRWSP